MTLAQLRVHATLRRLALSKKPILIGPWRSELGFEALYWLPFLRWAVQRYKLPQDRLVTLTRGGVGLLYGTAGIDLYRLRSVEAVRLENGYDWQKSKLQKQTGITPWDRDVLKEAAAQVLGRGASYHVLHPSLMYQALAPWWDGVRGDLHLRTMTDYAVLAKPKRLAGLPPDYVAMKWYQRATFDGHQPAVAEMVARMVGVVGSRVPIVLMTGTPETDDHADLVIEHPSVTVVPTAPPDQNLGQQLQILAHAKAFIGTYGGVAQTALRFGVPSASFWHAWGGTAEAHLTLSRMLSHQTGTPFLTAQVSEVPLWSELIVPRLVDAPKALAETSSVVAEAVPC